MDNAIRVQGLCKHYPDFSLENVSFTVPTGTIVGFIGENGAGKTTTLKAILGATHIDSGIIEVLGCSDSNKIEKGQIGVVFEDSFFPETLTAYHVSKIMKHIHPNWDSNTFWGFITNFKLPEKKLIKDMSKGMRMKLRLAAAMAHNPKLLILDEATSGLDPVVRSEVLGYLRDYIQDETHSILISSHITSDLEKIADSIVYLHQGKLMFQMEKDDLLNQYGILKCAEQQLNQIPKELLVFTIPSHFSCETLICDVQTVHQLLPDAIIDRPSIEDIMRFFARRDAQ